MAKRKAQMRRLAEGVYERDGRKIVRWWEPDGKGGGTRKQETLPDGTTLKEAKRFKSDKEEEKSRPKGREVTCDEFARHWPQDYPVGAGGRPRGESTIRQHNERVSKFADDFAGRLIASVDRAEARLWANANPSRVKSVRTMFNDAFQDGYVKSNPFEGLTHRGPERGRQDIVVLSESEIERLQEIARDLFPVYGQVLAGGIGIAAWTCMRPGELYALEWDDIDFTNREIHVTAARNRAGVTNPKWNSKRVIALLPQAEELLHSIPRHPFLTNVVWTSRGQHFTTRSWHHYWDRVRAVFWSELPKSRKAYTEEEAIRERKIPPGFDFYELRHFGASYLANVLGASSREIAKQMGHKDGGRLAERLYVHTEDDQATASILERARRVAEDRERQAV